MRYLSYSYLRVTVEHAEIRDDNWHGQGNDQDTGQGAKGAHNEAGVSLGHHITVAHCGHRDDGPPKALGNALEVVGRISLQSFGVIDQRGEYHHAQHEEEDQ